MDEKVRVIVSFRLKDKNMEFLPNLVKFSKETDKFPGCISHEFLVESDEPNQFTFVELWQNKNALDQYTSSEHFKSIAPFVAQYFDQLSVRIMNYVSI